MAKRLDVIEQSFLDTVQANNLIEKNDVIVVGVSGGPDSITLLACLNKYKEKFGYKLVVAHINHLIRKDSTEDEEFVENTCKKLGIEFFVKRAEVEKLAEEEKRGTEDMGRMIRYEFFKEVASKVNANKIAIAHNMNDNAETMIMNLLRGTGLTGLEGIQPINEDRFDNNDLVVIRPLINCKREDIENYCEVNNLNPRIDSTNKENIYRRNEIRNELIPYLKKFNPNIVETLSRTSKVIKDSNDFIASEVEKSFKEIVKEENKEIIIDVNSFNELEKTIQRGIILKSIEEILGNVRSISKVNIDDICELANRGEGNKEITFNNLKFSIKNKKLIIAQLV